MVVSAVEVVDEPRAEPEGFLLPGKRAFIQTFIVAISRWGIAQGEQPSWPRKCPRGVDQQAIFTTLIHLLPSSDSVRTTLSGIYRIRKVAPNRKKGEKGTPTSLGYRSAKHSGKMPVLEARLQASLIYTFPHKDQILRRTATQPTPSSGRAIFQEAIHYMYLYI